MDKSVIISIISALFCVLGRAALNVIDKRIFSKPNVDFFKGLTLNALFPFLSALLVASIFSDFFMNFHSYNKALFFNLGVILSALGAQIAASFISFGFKKMPIKAVAISTKFADLFIPAFVFLVSDKLNYREYLFAIFTTLAFFPIIRSLILSKFCFYPKVILLIILSLCFQAIVNSYFGMSKMADSWSKFLVLMVYLLFWRFTFMGLFSFFMKKVVQKEQNGSKKQLHGIPVFAGRALLAFLSQAAFFFSITRGSTIVAWPILNATALASCYAASFWSGEAAGKAEKITIVLFTSIFGCYVAWILTN